jgi:hypothetical protein
MNQEVAMNATLYPRTPEWLAPRERHGRIAQRAYERWLCHGCPSGTAVQDWLEAEAEVDQVLIRQKSETEHWPHLTDD